MSFCFLYNVVSENYRVQNSPWGGGGLLPAQGLMNQNVPLKDIKIGAKNITLTQNSNSNI